MTIILFLIHLPSIVILILISGFLGAGGWIGTWLFRKYVKVNYSSLHNEATNMIFSIVGGLYGLLLAFIVFLVWDQFNQSQKNANIEGSMAKALFRNINYYPDTAAVANLRNAYDVYIDNVITKEFPLMMERKQTSETINSFSDVYEELELLNQSNSDSRIDMMFEQMNELAVYRNLRLLDGSSEIAIDIWLPILLGAFITFLFAMMLKVESLRHHMIINSLLGAFIGLILFLVVIMDRPFTGEMAIKPRAYLQIKVLQKEAHRLKH